MSIGCLQTHYLDLEEQSGFLTYPFDCPQVDLQAVNGVFEAYRCYSSFFNQGCLGNMPKNCSACLFL